MNSKGFSRVLELVLVLVLLFALVTTLTQTMTPAPESTENVQVISRYAADFKNMVCNSRQDREIILKNLSLSSINNSINYVKPSGLKHRIVILNSSNQAIINSIGQTLPENDPVMTSSCMMVKGNTQYEAEVMVWY